MLSIRCRVPYRRVISHYRATRWITSATQQIASTTETSLEDGVQETPSVEAESTNMATSGGETEAASAEKPKKKRAKKPKPPPPPPAPLPKEVLDLSETLLEEPMRAGKNDVADMRPSSMKDFTEKGREALIMTIDRSFTRPQIDAYAKGLGLKRTGKKSDVIERIVDYWAQEKIAQIAPDLEWKGDAVAKTCPIDPSHLVYFNKYRPGLFDPLQKDGMHIEIGKDSIKIQGTPSQVQRAEKRLQRLLQRSQPSSATCFWPADATQRVTPHFLPLLEQLTHTLILQQDHQVLVLGSDKSVRRVVSAIEEALGLYRTFDTHAVCLHVPSFPPDTASPTYNLMPVYDTFSMSLVQRYSEPNRIISTSDMIDSSIWTLDDKARPDYQHGQFIWIQGQPVGQSDHPESIYHWLQKAAEYTAQHGFTVSAQITFGRALFYQPKQFGLVDTSLRHHESYSDTHIANVISHLQYRPTFLPNYTASAILGKHVTLKRPMQYIELEYSHLLENTSVNTPAEHIHVRLGIQEDKSCQLHDIRLTQYPLYMDIAVPIGRADISICLDATAPLQCSEALQDKFNQCIFKSKEAPLNVPTLLEKDQYGEVHIAQVTAKQPSISPSLFSLRAMRMISEETQPWRGFHLKIKRFDECFNGIPTNQCLLSSVLYTPNMELSSEQVYQKIGQMINASLGIVYGS